MRPDFFRARVWFPSSKSHYAAHGRAAKIKNVVFDFVSKAKTAFLALCKRSGSGMHLIVSNKQRSGPVSRVLYFCPRAEAVVIHLGLQLPTGSSSLPGSSVGHACCFPIWPCYEWGLPQLPSVTVRDGALLPHPFTITSHKTGCLFSVALSRGHPHRSLSGILPCVARTFLGRDVQAQPLTRPPEPLRSADFTVYLRQ